MTATAAIRAQEFLTATAGEGCTTRKGAIVAPCCKLPQIRSRAVRRLEHADSPFVCRERLEANSAPLNDKLGNFAGVGEHGLHGTQ